MKIYSLIKKILSLKFSFNLPSKKSLLVFDDEAIQDLRYILDDYNYFILSVRINKIKTVYVNIKILIGIIKNIKHGFFKSYLISIIEQISPKVIITNIDNSWQFSEIAKILSLKYNFFAIQNGSRHDFKRYEHQYKMGIYKKNMNKIFFIPNLFCFGDFEVDDYKKFNIPVKNFYPVGSLKLANYLKLKNINLEKNVKYKYDICLVSDSMVLHFDKRFGTNNDIDKMGKFFQYTIKYVRENNKNFICAFAKINSSKKILENELLFFKTYLKKDDYEFLLKNSTLNFTKHNYLTYDAMLSSNLSLTAFSTLLREHMSIGRKALSVNFMKNDLFKFPINGDCKLDDCNYDEFKKHIDKILNLNEFDYLQSFEKPVGYLMKYDSSQSTIEKIKKIINLYI